MIQIAASWSCADIHGDSPGAFKNSASPIHNVVSEEYMKDAPLKNLIYVLSRISADEHNEIYETPIFSKKHIL